MLDASERTVASAGGHGWKEKQIPRPQLHEIHHPIPKITILMKEGNITNHTLKGQLQYLPKADSELASKPTSIVANKQYIPYNSKPTNQHWENK